MPEIMVDQGAFFGKGMRAELAAQAEREAAGGTLDVQRGQLQNAALKAEAERRKELRDRLFTNIKENGEYAKQIAAGDPAKAGPYLKSLADGVKENVALSLANGNIDQNEAKLLTQIADNFTALPTMAAKGVGEGSQAISKAQTIGSAFGQPPDSYTVAGMAGLPDQYVQEGIGPNGQIMQRNMMTNQVAGASGSGKGTAAPTITIVNGEERLPMTKEATNAGQKQLVATGLALERVNTISNTFNPEWLTGLGRAVKWGQTGLDYLGLLPQKYQKDFSSYTAFASDTTDNLNNTIRDLSGAAMTEPEAVRISKTVPVTDDGPIAYQAKLSALRDRMTKIYARLADAQKNGIQMDFVPIFDQSGKPVGQKANDALEIFFMQNPIENYQPGKPKIGNIPMPPSPDQIKEALPKGGGSKEDIYKKFGLE